MKEDVIHLTSSFSVYYRLCAAAYNIHLIIVTIFTLVALNFHTYNDFLATNRKGQKVSHAKTVLYYMVFSTLGTNRLAFFVLHMKNNCVTFVFLSCTFMAVKPHAWYRKLLFIFVTLFVVIQRYKNQQFSFIVSSSYHSKFWMNPISLIWTNIRCYWIVDMPTIEIM